MNDTFRPGLDRIGLPNGVDGQLWLCSKHVVGPAPEEVRGEIGEGTVVVSFNKPGDLAMFDGYAAWLASSPDARWFPIMDFHAPDLDDALVMLDEIVGLLRAGRPVLMHCSAGVGRTGTMAVAVLMLLGVDMDHALEQVARQRRGAGPEVGAQRNLILALDAYLTGP
jgi:hypothetical protein